MPGSRLASGLIALKRCVTIAAPASAAAARHGARAFEWPRLTTHAGCRERGGSAPSLTVSGAIVISRTGILPAALATASRNRPLPSAGSGSARARPCAPRKGAVLPGGGPGSRERVPLRPRPRRRARARLISGVSVISVGSSAVVPKRRVRAADRARCASTVGRVVEQHAAAAIDLKVDEAGHQDARRRVRPRSLPGQALAARWPATWPSSPTTSAASSCQSVAVEYARAGDRRIPGVIRSSPSPCEGSGGESGSMPRRRASASMKA